MTTQQDERLDPRIRDLLALLPPADAGPDVVSREALLAEMNTPEALELYESAQAIMEMLDNEDLAPSAGLDIEEFEFTSAPDGNTVKINYLRPKGAGVLPCVYYIHGGGMATMSAFSGLYRSWGRLIASQGVAVAMVDFRNSVYPSTAPEVEPFPAGLNDCVSGLDWVVAHAAELNIDAGRVIVAGDSGGGNLCLATALKLKELGKLDLIQGIYALCPFIAGEWPQERLPSSTENNGIMLDLHTNRWRMGYGIEAFEAKNPQAWPLFASEDDVAGFPRTLIHVNECDPLRDEGIEFYRLLARAGVVAQCREVKGTSHGGDMITIAVPDVSLATATSIAHWAAG